MRLGEQVFKCISIDPHPRLFRQDQRPTLTAQQWQAVASALTTSRPHRFEELSQRLHTLIQVVARCFCFLLRPQRRHRVFATNGTSRTAHKIAKQGADVLLLPRGIDDRLPLLPPTAFQAKLPQHEEANGSMGKSGQSDGEG